MATQTQYEKTLEKLECKWAHKRTYASKHSIVLALSRFEVLQRFLKDFNIGGVIGVLTIMALLGSIIVGATSSAIYGDGFATKMIIDYIKVLVTYLALTPVLKWISIVFEKLESIPDESVLLSKIEEFINHSPVFRQTVGSWCAKQNKLTKGDWYQILHASYRLELAQSKDQDLIEKTIKEHQEAEKFNHSILGTLKQEALALTEKEHLSKVLVSAQTTVSTHRL